MHKWIYHMNFSLTSQLHAQPKDTPVVKALSEGNICGGSPLLVTCDREPPLICSLTSVGMMEFHSSRGQVAAFNHQGQPFPVKGSREVVVGKDVRLLVIDYMSLRVK